MVYIKCHGSFLGKASARGALPLAASQILADLCVQYVGIVLNCCSYGVLYLGSYYNTGPYINFFHLGNSNLGKLPCGLEA